jgi:Lrp/AsnC family leucine-responsive transcriptional regulator
MTLSTDRLLDATGWEILRALQEDGRLPFRALGKRVGLSSPAVAERVRRLEDAGIITGYRAVVDPAKVGTPLTAFVRFVSPGYNDARFAELARALPQVLECHRVTGADSFILKVVVASIPQLETLVDTLKAYGESTTAIVTSSPVEARALSRALLEPPGSAQPGQRSPS